MPISGLLDIAPIAKPHVQTRPNLTPDEVAELGPARHIPRRTCPIVVACTHGEPAGFERQPQADETELWREAGNQSSLLCIGERHHFDVVLDLASEESRLTQSLPALVHGN